MTAPKSNSENSLYLKFCREKKMVYIEATYQDTLEKFIPKICSFLNKPVEFSRFYKKDLVKAFIDEFSWREKMREIWCKFKNTGNAFLREQLLDEKAKFHDLGLQSNDIIKVLFKKEASKYKKKSVSFLLFFKTVGEEPSEWEPLDLLEEFGNFSKPVANVA